jgi:hypothetical protein
MAEPIEIPQVPQDSIRKAIGLLPEYRRERTSIESESTKLVLRHKTRSTRERTREQK